MKKLISIVILFTFLVVQGLVLSICRTSQPRADDAIKFKRGDWVFIWPAGDTGIVRSVSGNAAWVVVSDRVGGVREQKMDVVCLEKTSH